MEFVGDILRKHSGCSLSNVADRVGGVERIWTLLDSFKIVNAYIPIKTYGADI